MALRRAQRRRMLMEPGRWARITEIYHATIARPPEERVSFVGQECHGDETLRRQVEAMVKSHERSGDFIETPAFAIAPELLIEVRTVDLIGQSIGHYQIESLLGAGGMGEVYLARDDRLGRKVALKLLPEHLTADETQLSRFKAEARSASALNHPNILTVYEIGAEGNRHFIATEFIEGMTLRASLARGGMNLQAALEIAVQVASALAAAREAGVVHRDIKPENIMLRPDGHVKALDCWIAKPTQKEPPPLSGALPDVPLKLEEILQKALRKDRDERHQTARELLGDLHTLKGELELAGPVRAGVIVRQIKRHKRGVLLMLAVAILA